MPIIAIVLLLALAACARDPAPEASVATAAATLPDEPVIGVQLYSFRHQLSEDVRETLRKVREMGFTAVEVAGYSWESADQFRSMLDEAGLEGVGMFADYQALHSDFDSVVADARALGVRYVIVGWIPHQPPFSLADVDAAAADFNEWGQKLDDHGLRFAYHVHGYEFHPHGDGTLWDRLMERTDPDHVAVEMDVFWVAHPGQDPVAFLERYGHRVELMHLKDLQSGVQGDLTGTADVELNVTLGTGQIDFPAVIEAARRAGVRYFFLEDESSRVMEQIPASLSYVRGLLAN